MKNNHSCIGGKTCKEKSSVQDFADKVKSGDVEDIIEWARREIEEYQKLISILENK